MAPVRLLSRGGHQTFSRCPQDILIIDCPENRMAFAVAVAYSAHSAGENILSRGCRQKLRDSPQGVRITGFSTNAVSTVALATS